MKLSNVFTLLFLLLIPLFVQAQDVKMNKIHQEKIEEERDTLSLKKELIEYKELLIDTLKVDSVLPWPLYMTSRLDSTLRTSPYMKGISAGVMVYDMTSDSLLFSHNEKKLMKPASNMKLFSGISGLRELGADYEFKTRLYHTGEIRQDTIFFIPDSLRLGIPLEELVDTLGNPQYRYVKVLHGDLIGVGSYDPMFTTNDLNLFVDRIKSLEIDSITGNYLEDDHFRFSTSINPLQVNKAGNFMNQLKLLLEKKGIKSSGFVGSAKCSEDTLLIAEKSHTLREIMNRMMKNSDNQYAENVFQRTHSLTKPIHAVNKLINDIGFNPNNFVIADGSGLSHDNRVSPELEVALLRYARKDDSIYPVLYENLPIAGVDGTLESRMKDTSAYKNVRAKTGTINGVITLAGYCTSANNHELAFAIMLNDISSQLTAKALEDELCTIMTHDESIIPKKRVIVVKRRPVRKRPVPRPRRKR